MRSSISSGNSSESFPATAHIASVALLFLSLAFALVWSHFKFFWVDELLGFYSDGRPTFSAVLAGQLRYPFSLEPPAYHLFLHAMQRVLPTLPELATRLPSIAGLLITQVCVLRITSRLTGNWRAALVAMALPFTLATFVFAPEARIYSILATLFALAVLAYQAVQDAAPGRRALPLCGLFLALSGAILVHFYGIFLLLPFFVAELVRAWRLHRIDLAPWLTLFAALAVFALNVPFLHALGDIQAHYYDASQAGWVYIPFTYAWFFGQYNIFDRDLYGNIIRPLTFWIALLGLPAAVGAVVVRYRRQQMQRVSLSVLTVLLAGLLLPVVNVAVAHFVTHAYVPRYSLPAVVSVSILLVLAIAPQLRRPAIFLLVMTLLLAVGCVQALHDIAKERRLYAIGLSDHAVTPELQAAQAATADPHIYIQDVARFLTTYTYAPSPIQRDVVGFQSIDRELFWLHRTPASMFLRNMSCSTSLPVISYEALRRKPGPHLLVLYDDAFEEWIGKELAAQGAAVRVESLGRAFGGRLLRVTFVATPESVAPNSIPGSADWRCASGVVR